MVWIGASGDQDTCILRQLVHHELLPIILKVTMTPESCSRVLLLNHVRECDRDTRIQASPASIKYSAKHPMFDRSGFRDIA